MVVDFDEFGLGVASTRRHLPRGEHFLLQPLVLLLRLSELLLLQFECVEQLVNLLLGDVLDL